MEPLDKAPIDSIIDQFVHFPATDVKKCHGESFQFMCYTKNRHCDRAAVIKMLFSTTINSQLEKLGYKLNKVGLLELLSSELNLINVPSIFIA